jgi:hypothetical protein
MKRCAIFSVAVSLLIALGCFAPTLQAFDPEQQDDSLAVLRHFQTTSESPPAFVGGEFALREGETISLIGGSEMEEMAEAGYFEALLQNSFAQKRPQVRSIAWSADTVYRQQRPMFFFTAQGDTREGSVPDGRERIAPGVIIVQFGKMESLDGEAALPGFEKTFDTLVVELKKISPRIVLVSPSPFFVTGPAVDLTAERNRTLAKYAAAVQVISNRHKTVFVDLGAALDASDKTLSRNGVHLSDKGKKVTAGKLADALWDSEKPDAANGPLRSAIQKKNFLWQQYFRPTNWAFLYGDRQHVPSSRDHKDTERRWFIEELNQLPGRLAAADSDIWKEAGQ